MFKSLSALTLAGALLLTASPATADDRRYDRQVRDPYVHDYRGSRVDLRHARRIDRRLLTKAERRALRRAERRAERLRLLRAERRALLRAERRALRHGVLYPYRDVRPARRICR